MSERRGRAVFIALSVMSTGAIADGGVTASPVRAAAAADGPGLVRIGGEVLVNQLTAGAQGQADLADASGGGVLAVWQDRGHVLPSGTATVTSSRFLDGDGRPDGADRVLLGTGPGAESHDVSFPQVETIAAPIAGDFTFFVATAFRDADGRIDVTRHDTAPSSLPQPTTAGAIVGQSDIGQLAGNGNYALVTTNGDIVLDLLGGDTSTYVNDVVVNAATGTTGLQSEPAVAGSADGLDVVFRDVDDIRLTSVDSAGQFVRSRLITLPGTQRDPDVVGMQPTFDEPARPAGAVVVFVDEDSSGDGSGTAVRAQYVGVGGVVSSVVTVNATTAGDQTEPVVTLLPGNRVFVAWTDASGAEGAGGSGTAVRGRVLAIEGDRLVPAGAELIVNTFTAGDQHEPAVVTTTDGRVTVAWTSSSGVLDRDGSGISAQTFELDAVVTGGKVPPSGRQCFGVSGDAGDVAVVNLTPVSADGPGSGQLVPSDVLVPPVASNVNFRVGSIDPNVAVARIGADGRVCFANSQHANVHLVADHLVTIDSSGFVAASADGAPLRVVDTRVGLGGGKVPPSGRVCFAAAGSAGDVAVVNLTPVEAEGLGSGQLVPSDVVSPPVASNVNFGPGSVDPNVAFARLGGDGRVCFVNSVHVPVHLVADVLGTVRGAGFQPAGPGGGPVRVLDTRAGGGAAKVAPSGRACFAVAGTPGDLAVVNLTPVEAEGLGSGQLVSSDVVSPPVASNVNFAAGSFDPNVAIAPIGADGRVCYVNSVHVRVHLVADHLGTITRAVGTPAASSGAPLRRLDTRPLLLGTNILSTREAPFVDAQCTSTGCTATTWEPLLGCAGCPGGQVLRYVRATGAWSPLGEPGLSASGVACLESGVCVRAANQPSLNTPPPAAAILRSVDGGGTWVQVLSPPAPVSQVVCTASGTCLVPANDSLLRSVDSGATWTTLPVDIDLVDCPSDTTCVGAGGATSWLSVDAGATWTQRAPIAKVTSLACSGVTTCIATTGTRSIVSTADAGATWNPTVLPAALVLESVDCAGSECFGIADIDSLPPAEFPNTVGMLRSTDAGATWQRVEIAAGRLRTQALSVTCRPSECVVAGYGIGTGGGGFVTIVTL